MCPSCPCQRYAPPLPLPSLARSAREAWEFPTRAAASSALTPTKAGSGYSMSKCQPPWSQVRGLEGEQPRGLRPRGKGDGMSAVKGRRAGLRPWG